VLENNFVRLLIELYVCLGQDRLVAAPIVEEQLIVEIQAKSAGGEPSLRDEDVVETAIARHIIAAPTPRARRVALAIGGVTEGISRSSPPLAAPTAS
jgi:hypothetical protein